jgi:hypothetical protein
MPKAPPGPGPAESPPGPGGPGGPGELTKVDFQDNLFVDALTNFLLALEWAEKAVLDGKGGASGAYIPSTRKVFFNFVSGVQLSWTADNDYFVNAVSGDSSSYVLSMNPSDNWNNYGAVGGVNTAGVYANARVISGRENSIANFGIYGLHFNVYAGETIYCNVPSGATGKYHIWLTTLH